MASLSLIKAKLHTKYLFFKKKAAYWLSGKSADEIAFSMSKNEIDALEISVKVGCGLFCDYCPQDEYIQNYRSKYKSDEKVLTEETFKAVLRNVPTSVYMKWTGFTEPLDSKVFPALALHLRDSGYKQQISTTLHGHPASVFWFRDNLEMFKQITLHLPDDSGLMKSQVDDAYLAILDQVVKNATDLGFGEDRLVVFLIGNDFHHEIKPLLDSYRNKGLLCDSQIQRAAVLNTRNSTIDVDKLGIAKVSTRPFERREDHAEHYYCAYRRLNAGVLLPNGEVTICSQDYNLDYILGNLKRESLGSLYARIQTDHDLSRKFLAGEFFPCTKCEHYKPISSSFSGHLRPVQS